MKGPLSFLIFVSLGAVVLAGLSFYERQLDQGLAVTGLNSQVTWGIYIVNFIFCIGLSAGGIVVSALVHAFRIRKLKAVALIAEILALSFLLMAATCIILDLGHPERAFFVLIHSNLRSPLLWDVMAIGLYLVLCVALLWCSLRAELQELRGGVHLGRFFRWVLGQPTESARRQNALWLRRLSMVSIPAAIALHSVTAWILGLAKGQPGWNTAILAPLFIASALVSGIGAVILGAAFARRLFGVLLPRESIEVLGRYLFFLLPLLIYLLLSEFLTISYTGGLSHQAVMEEIVLGRFRTFFWFDMMGGILVPFFLLGLWRRSLPTIEVAALLAVAGVLAERVNILLPSLMRLDPLRGEAAYLPSMAEITMVAAVYAAGALIFCLFAYALGRLGKERPERLLEGRPVLRLGET